MESVNWAWGLSLIALTIAIHAMGVVMMAIVGWGPGLGWTPGTWFPARNLDRYWRRRCACDAEQIEGSARQPVNPRHRHHVAGATLPAILLSSRRSARARYLVAVDVPAAASGRAKLLELSLKRLPVRADAING